LQAHRGGALRRRRGDARDRVLGRDLQRARRRRQVLPALRANAVLSGLGL